MTDYRLLRRDVLKGIGAATLSSAISLPALAQTSSALGFGFQNNAWASLGILADQKKFFPRFGADVKVYPFDSGKAVRDAMISNRIDVGVMGTTPFLIGASKGELVGIGMAMYSAKTDSVVVRADGKISSIQALKGKKIASQLGSATDYVFQAKILPRYGLTPADVQIVNVPFPNHIAALASGSVDAFAGVEPYPSIAEVEKLGLVLIDYSDFDMLPVVLTANRSAVEKRRNDLIKFMQAWLAAADFFKTNENEAGQIILNYFTGLGFTVKPEVIKVMVKKLDINTGFVPELLPYLKEEAEMLKKEGKITALPDFNTLLNDEFLRLAAEKS